VVVCALTCLGFCAIKFFFFYCVEWICIIVASLLGSVGRPILLVGLQCTLTTWVLPLKRRSRVSLVLTLSCSCRPSTGCAPRVSPEAKSFTVTVACLLPGVVVGPGIVSCQRDYSFESSALELAFLDGHQLRCLPWFVSQASWSTGDELWYYPVTTSSCLFLLCHFASFLAGVVCLGSRL